MHADIVRKHCSGLWATLKDAQAAVDQAADELLSSVSNSSSVAARLTPRSRENNQEALVNRLPEMQEGLEAIKAQCRAELQETPFCHFTPQTSYLTEGSLRAQLIYPDTIAIQSDDRLAQFIETVGLGYLLERGQEVLKLKNPNLSKRWELMYGTARMELMGLEHCASWVNCLSGGEQQRLVFARVLYHNPQFSLLDEATSALNTRLEAQCVDSLISNGVKMVHVSHRANVAQYHETALDLIGEGQWKLENLRT